MKNIELSTQCYPTQCNQCYWYSTIHTGLRLAPLCRLKDKLLDLELNGFCADKVLRKEQQIRKNIESKSW